MDLKYFLRNPINILLKLDNIGILKFSDKRYLKMAYKSRIKKKLNIDKPETFNEKMQWLKLYDRNPEYTKMVDKYNVKEYIATIIGEKYIIPTLGVYDKFNDIDFNILPDEFVIKTTHDSGGVFICRNKSLINIKKAKKIINKSLKRRYYSLWREWPYKDVKPRIIIEKYMKDNENTDLLDYKLMCFNGKVKCSFVCTDRYTEDGLKVTFFDRNWKKMPFERHYPSDKKEIPKPQNYEKMVELAEKLSKGISFVRVDFYEINKKIYFGELTFYPGGGFEEFNPESYDLLLGSWIKLPNKKGA